MLVFDLETDRNIINHGVRAEGTVESVDFHHDKKSIYETVIQVRYAHPDGTPMRFEQSIKGTYEQGPKANKRDIVTVYLDPATRPEQAIAE
ncbi:hypothetical protein GD627_00175 [Arthrobacter yangruifuii]|uniref:Uncharacterized protein n=1 Tax=Arthrobacter yangruifuii TaxID=2606616 RepID=A0A5N6MS00_9MICC|nr:hypothetical protein [Arthrobacter yangruifuii]KAD4059573.1 hypothetical protein GD627_00175 [Arthrobacter yangruifuii]